MKFLLETSPLPSKSLLLSSPCSRAQAFCFQMSSDYPCLLLQSCRACRIKEAGMVRWWRNLLLCNSGPCLLQIWLLLCIHPTRWKKIVSVKDWNLQRMWNLPWPDLFSHPFTGTKTDTSHVASLLAKLRITVGSWADVQCAKCLSLNHED